MTKTALEGFRKFLEDKQAELRDGITDRRALAIESSPDELDRIQQARDREDAIGNLERNSGRLREVRSALRRIEAQTFGICVECEQNISPRRLAAVPWASLCIVCQEAADIEQLAPADDFEASFAA